MTLSPTHAGTTGVEDRYQLAGSAEQSHSALRQYTSVVLDTIEQGRQRLQHPIPPGGPEATAINVRSQLQPILPEFGADPSETLAILTELLATGSANPAHPSCAAHLHGPPLALAVAADLAASTYNPSLDSWDQSPAASEIEALISAQVSVLAYPHSPDADALVTTGATESNLVAVLLAREEAQRASNPVPLQVICSTEAHHSVSQAAWMLGLPEATQVPALMDGTIDIDALDATLSAAAGPTFVVATAGTTSRGVIDPLDAIGALCRLHNAHFHVDAAYGGALLFSDQLSSLLQGIEHADTISMDLHKFGWQPLAAGLLAVSHRQLLSPISITADYLNSDDDQDAGLPDLLGRSIRTSRRPDVVKIAATFRALGRRGISAMVEQCCSLAQLATQHIRDECDDVEVLSDPTLSTILFRPTVVASLPTGIANAVVAQVRRELLLSGEAVIGRATIRTEDNENEVWLKLTLLNPHTSLSEIKSLLRLTALTAETLISPVETELAS